MNFESKISTALAFIIIITIALSALIIMESFFVVVNKEMDAIIKTI